MLMDSLVEPVLPSIFKLVAETVSLLETSTSTMSISPALEDAGFGTGVLCGRLGSCYNSGRDTVGLSHLPI